MTREAEVRRLFMWPPVDGSSGGGSPVDFLPQEMRLGEGHHQDRPFWKTRKKAELAGYCSKDV